MRASRRPRGFSLTEVLVCSGIVVVLATLLGPAILTAQTGSQEQKCKNNLKQLGLALHNYHDTYNRFAPGWVTKNQNSTEIGGNGWQASILPYMDQAPLYNQINFDTGFDVDAKPESLKGFRTVVKIYRCPSDTAPKENQVRGGWPTSNYSGNGGHRPFPQWSSVPGKSFWPGAVNYDPKANWASLNSGLFYANSSIGIRDITDGTSNTIMIGERSAKSGAGIWPGVTRNCQENDAITDGSHASRIQKSIRGFSSPHREVFFMMGDGAVRAIKADIDSQPNTDPQQPLGVFQKLMSRNDNQAVQF